MNKTTSRKTQPKKAGISKSGNIKKKRSRRRRTDGLTRTEDRSGNALTLNRNQFTSFNALDCFKVMRASTPGGMRVRGREMVATLTASVAGAVTQGLNWNFVNNGAITTASFMYLNPYNFPRLTGLMSIFEQYYFHSADTRLISSRATGEAGNTTMAVDYDPKDNILVTPNTISYLSNISSSTANVYSDQGFRILGPLSRLQRYFGFSPATSLDRAQINQAALYAMSEGDNVLGVGFTLGYVIMDYDVEFFTPQNYAVASSNPRPFVPIDGSEDGEKRSPSISQCSCTSTLNK